MDWPLWTGFRSIRSCQSQHYNRVGVGRLLRRTMAQSTNCPRCEDNGALTIGQSSRGGKLRWYESVNCPRCGLRSEADGEGLPPDELRRLLMARDGVWAVRLSGSKSGAAAGKVLRDALGLDMRQVSLLLKQLPGVAYEGTKGESSWLVDLLIAAGESPVLERVSAPGG